MMFSDFFKMLSRFNRTRNHDQPLTVSLMHGPGTLAENFKIKDARIYGTSQGFTLVLMVDNQEQG